MAEFLASDGVTIHYEVEGTQYGPPLVFSNSLGTNFHMWDGQVGKATELGFRVICYDQRGHGRSAAPKENYSLARLADDLHPQPDQPAQHRMIDAGEDHLGPARQQHQQGLDRDREHGPEQHRDDPADRPEAAAERAFREHVEQPAAGQAVLEAQRLLAPQAAGAEGVDRGAGHGFHVLQRIDRAS